MYKNTKRTSKGSSIRIELRDYSGIDVRICYVIDGTKHNTFVDHTFQFNFCDLKQIGRNVHKIMDELSDEWHITKNILKGKRQ